MSRSSVSMCEGPLLPKIILYTVPIMLTGILQLLFNAADLVVVGRYCGSVSVAAVGATGSLINLIINLFIGLSVGAGVSVAQNLGASNDKNVLNIVHTAIPSALVSGAFLTFVGYFGSDFFLKLMGTPDDVIELSALYMKIYFFGITASMIYNFGAAILRAAGDTKGPLLFLTSAGVINVILNIIFVRFFDMDVAGVALATAVSQTIAATLVLIALGKRKDACKLSLKSLHFDKTSLKEMMRIGIPAGIQGSLFSISNVIIQSGVNSFGSVVMSGNASASNIEGFVYTSMNAFHHTALNFTGQNFGAKKYERLPKILFLCLGLVSAVGILSGGAVYLCGRPLLSIYITDSPQAIEYGIVRLGFIALPYFLCGIMDVMTGAIRGIGASFIPMLITVLGVCVFRIGWIFSVFKMPEYHTVKSLYISYPISWVLTFIAELIAYFIIYKRKVKH